MRSERPSQERTPAAVNPKILCLLARVRNSSFKHGSAAIQSVDLLSAETPRVDGHVFEMTMLKMASKRQTY